VTMFLLVIWICLKKYKGLEREARKVLQAYQNKRLRRNRKIWNWNCRLCFMFKWF